MVSILHFLNHANGFLGALFANRDERKVLPYTLPLVSKSRKEILELFKSEMYGVMPEDVPESNAHIVEKGEAFGGSAIRKQIALRLSRDGKSAVLNLLMYIPKGVRSYSTILVGNFDGNHSISPDEAVLPTVVWSRRFADTKRVFHEKDRNKYRNRFPVEKILKRGYAVVTFCYGDADPDYDDNFKNGVHALYPELQEREDNWASVGAWGWSFSRVLDFLQTEKEIDANRVALYGFSRIGKASLWAGACDERFGAVIAEGSGKGGRLAFASKFWRNSDAYEYAFSALVFKVFSGICKRYKYTFCRSTHASSTYCPSTAFTLSRER